MPPTLTVFERSPDGGKGLARDMPVRWALDFSAGDLMVISVLRRLKRSSLLQEFSNLHDYVARGEARPAFQRGVRTTESRD